MKKAYQISIRFAFYVKLFFNVDKSLVSCCVNVNEKFRSMAHFPSFLFLNIIRTFMHMINPFGQFIRIFQKRTRPFRVFCILPGSCIRMSLMIDRNRYLQLQGKFATNLHPRLHFDLSLEQTLSTASFISLKNSGRHWARSKSFWLSPEVFDIWRASNLLWLVKTWKKEANERQMTEIQSRGKKGKLEIQHLKFDLKKKGF